MFLLKRGTARYYDALDEPDQLTRYPLKQSLPFNGVLYVAPQRTAMPRWLEFLEEGVRDDLERLFNASTSAVLFVRAARRLFAFTFGYGRSLLDPERIERYFGLRVVLNSVDEQSLQSLDTKTVQELTVHVRRQVSRASRMSEFGVDKEEDLLGSVAGVPRDSGFARHVSGSDAVRFRAPVTMVELADKCNQLIRSYRSRGYRDRGFEFVDHVRTVADPALVESLDEGLLDAIVSGDQAKMHMAPPEIVDWDALDGFSFTRNRDPEGELTLESFFDQIRNPHELSIKRLKQQRVYVHANGDAEPRPAWPVYRVLVSEQEYRGRRYVLSGGEWYAIDGTFARSIERRVRRIASGDVQLPDARAGESERRYNLRAGRERGIYCIDRECARIDGDAIEICDLFSSNREFVHVKRWRASSTLSHLFAQGRLSADAFLSDEKFRDGMRRLVGRRSRALANQIPHGRPDPSRFSVVFAIIKETGQGWRRDLPFFSKLHLARTAEHVRRLGFRVFLKRVGVG